MALKVFKAARIFDPAWFCVQNDTTIHDAVTELTNVPAMHMDEKKTSGILAEVPLYKASASGFDVKQDLVEWWRLHHLKLPLLCAGAQIAMLIQPSSAAAERVFSILNMFNSQQSRC